MIHYDCYLEFSVESLKKIIKAIEEEDSAKKFEMEIGYFFKDKYTIPINNFRKNLWKIGKEKV